MKLTFEQTSDDFMDFFWYTMKHHRSYKRVWILTGTGLILYCYLDLLKDDFQTESLFSLLISIITITILYYIIFKYSQKRRLRNPANRQMIVGKREIELSTDEIVVKTPISETVYQWSVMTKLEQSKKNYFLYLGNLQAILISKGAFNSGNEIQDFEDLIASKLQ